MNDIAVYSEYVRFVEDGRLDFATLARRHEHSGVVLESGQTIVLHENGKLRVSTLAADVQIGEHALGAGALIAFHPDGALDTSTVAGNTRWPLETSPLD